MRPVLLTALLTIGCAAPGADNVVVPQPDPAMRHWKNALIALEEGVPWQEEHKKGLDLFAKAFDLYSQALDIYKEPVLLERLRDINMRRCPPIRILRTVK